MEHAFGTNRSSATVAEGGTHDELRFKWVAHDGGLLAYGVLVLAGAGLVKYLLFPGSSTTKV